MCDEAGRWAWGTGSGVGSHAHCCCRAWHHHHRHALPRPPPPGPGVGRFPAARGRRRAGGRVGRGRRARSDAQPLAGRAGAPLCAVRRRPPRGGGRAGCRKDAGESPREKEVRGGRRGWARAGHRRAAACTCTPPPPPQPSSLPSDTPKPQVLIRPGPLDPREWFSRLPKLVALCVAASPGVQPAADSAPPLPPADRAAAALKAVAGLVGRAGYDATYVLFVAHGFDGPDHHSPALLTAEGARVGMVNYVALLAGPPPAVAAARAVLHGFSDALDHHMNAFVNEASCGAWQCGGVGWWAWGGGGRGVVGGVGGVLWWGVWGGGRA